MDNYDLKAAHNAARFNRDTLVQAGKCGCFYCLKIFTPLEIGEWCPEEEDGEEVTAICPHCGVDSVIGDNYDFSITQEFLTAMHGRWFGKDGIDA